MEIRDRHGHGWGFRCGGAWLLSAGLVGAWAGEVPPTVATRPQERQVERAAAESRDLNQWLLRIQNAPRKRAYVGTFVVMSSNGAMSSSRIWHACDGEQQVERIEALTGAPRSTFRKNDQVMTLLPQAQLVRIERRESLNAFPDLRHAADPALAHFYQVQVLGQDRVAGFDADVVLIKPRDDLRFGYRVWSERKSGLVIKTQILDGMGRVLEQSAFSEIDIDAPIRMDKIEQMMSSPPGFRVERPELVKTSLQQEGWALRQPVPGFQFMSCYRRSAAGGLEKTLQCTFSDGLATLSVFLEPPARSGAGVETRQDTQTAAGATQTLSRKVAGDWWLTVVGEAPQSTLRAFAQSLELRR